MQISDRIKNPQIFMNPNPKITRMATMSWIAVPLA